MKLRSIQLDKIGAYHSQTFDLTASEPGRNVTLIGGKNGSGKTTLLRAIKLGLYGCYAYGYKNENAEYLKKVYSHLNSHERTIEGRRFKIVLKFSEVENYQEQLYTFYRIWTYRKGNLKEEFKIIKDNRYLSESEKEIYQSKMREVMPPHLFDLCLFNGEEIGQILVKDQLPSYLGELANSLFNLDLFQALEEDLRTYADREDKRSDLSDQEQELQELLSRKQELMVEQETLEEQLNKAKEKMDHLEQEYAEQRRAFDAHGGLLKEEWNRKNEEVHRIEAERRVNDETVKDFISKLLPFHLNRKLLTQTREQMLRESEQQVYDQLFHRLDGKSMSRILQSLSTEVQKKELLARQLRESILRELEPDSYNNFFYIHRASFDQRSQVEEVYRRLENIKGTSYSGLVEKNQELLAQVQELRRSLKKSDAEEFAQILDRLEKIQEEIAETKSRWKSLKEAWLETEQEIDRLKPLIHKLHKEIDDSSKIASSYLISQKVLQLSEEFRKLQLKKNLQQVQIETLRMLKKLLRKNRYITSISIDPGTYRVTLKDHQGVEISKETLSAGEQELLLLSLVWAMFRCSGRRVPFIFDTLLGRLDQEHKSRVIKELVPTVGEQVIILSTDSEIDVENYQLIKPHVAKEYSLNFRTEERRIEVTPNYFRFEEVESS
ncbi:DNA sulfur modification protein DndD [Kroppenstedtia eburnea]|uniref:DNA sulfur modification protein DndD n=1 Tax=Kroppenstedtia eburnea TaxID=714067 RepID=UPI00362C44CA